MKTIYSQMRKLEKQETFLKKELEEIYENIKIILAEYTKKQDINPVLRIARDLKKSAMISLDFFIAHKQRDRDKMNFYLKKMPIIPSSFIKAFLEKEFSIDISGVSFERFTKKAQMELLKIESITCSSRDLEQEAVCSFLKKYKGTLRILLSPLASPIGADNLTFAAQEIEICYFHKLEENEEEENFHLLGKLMESYKGNIKFSMTHKVKVPHSSFEIKEISFYSKQDDEKILQFFEDLKNLGKINRISIYAVKDHEKVRKAFKRAETLVLY